MTTRLDFTGRERVLVFAPHPDDEALATGELLQLARAAGADVRVVFATDGDNNPWPQRYVERRLSIGAAERVRWGARRRREARASLDVLGVGGDAARFLSWPDQGVTERLLGADGSEHVLAEEIAAFKPTHVALPALDDRHPDHSALRVLVELALAASGYADVARLAYVVHGSAAPRAPIEIAFDAARKARKRDAVDAHHTQVALSRQRLLAVADRPERYDAAHAPSAIALDADANELIVDVPLDWRARWIRRHDVLIVLMTDAGVVRWRVAVDPVLSWPAGRVADTPYVRPLRRQQTAAGTRLALAAPNARVLRGYIKVERSWPRIWVFDEEGWHDVADWLAPAPSDATEIALFERST